MSDIMYPVSFGNLMNHIMTEYKMYNRIYNVNKIHRTNHDQRLSIFGKSIENPVGLGTPNSSPYIICTVF